VLKEEVETGERGESTPVRKSAAIGTPKKTPRNTPKKDPLSSRSIDLHLLSRILILKPDSRHEWSCLEDTNSQESQECHQAGGYRIRSH
jgi:hypothetical protein